MKINILPGSGRFQHRFSICLGCCAVSSRSSKSNMAPLPLERGDKTNAFATIDKVDCCCNVMEQEIKIYLNLNIQCSLGKLKCVADNVDTIKCSIINFL